MNKKVLERIFEQAEAEYPKECCGLIVGKKNKPRYVPCRNISEHEGAFAIHPEDWANAEDTGPIIKIIHSHCNELPNPSQADLVGCEKSGLPWVIVSWPTKQVYEFKPGGYEAPLIGREFVHGVVDCYTLVRDYYRLKLGIDLPDFDRQDDWWNKGENLYLENFGKAGFEAIPAEELAENDVILMQRRSPVPNHAAIYIGGQKILHHVEGRLSGEDVYGDSRFGGYWRKCTWSVIRHKTF